MPQSPQQMEQMVQLLENPIVSQMMDQMIQQNPDMLRGMLEQQNPMLRQMFQSNPQMANDMIRQMMNPQNLRQMIQLQQQMQNMGMMPYGMPVQQQQQQGGLDFSNLIGSQGGGASSQSSLPPFDFSGLMQQFQSMQTNSNSNSNMHPADRYRSQLQQLRDMGFDDESASLAALQANHGNLNRAVDQLLMGPPVPPPATTHSAPASSQQDSPAAEPKNSTEKKND